MKGKATVAGVSMLLLAITMSAFRTRADEAEVNGMISARTGDTLIVRASDGNVTTVVLADDTRTNEYVGLFGLEKKEISDVSLIPGLKVDVDGTTDEQGRVAAKTITVDDDDQANIITQTQQIQQNAQAIPEVTKRFLELDDYEVKDQTTVQFNSGSSAILAKYQEELKKLAQTARSLRGYTIEVTGYADSTGVVETNTSLSEERARAVVSFLMQQGGVPVRYIVAPGAMGEYGAAASNETTAGRAQNRRAEVKVLVNRGIAGD